MSEDDFTQEEINEMSDGEKIDNDICPQCGGRIFRQGGCASCPSCGWALCG